MKYKIIHIERIPKTERGHDKVKHFMLINKGTMAFNSPEVADKVCRLLKRMTGNNKYAVVEYKELNTRTIANKIKAVMAQHNITDIKEVK